MTHDIADLWGAILESARNYLFDIYEPLARDFQGTAIILLMIYIVISILILIRAGNFDMLMKMVVALIVFATVYQLVFTDGSSGFKEWVYSPIYHTSLNLTSYFVSLSPDNNDGITGVLRVTQKTAWDMAMIADKQLSAGSWWERFGIDRFFTGLVWIALAAGYALVVVAFVLYTLIGFLSMHILLVVSPVMMLLGAIPMTRHFFISWMKAVITFALIPPFCGVVMGLMTAFLNKTLLDFELMAAQADPFNITTAAMFIFYILAFGLLRKSPEFAASITGGVMTQLSGTGAAVAGAAVGYAAIASHSGSRGLGRAGTEMLGNRIGTAAKSWSERKVGA